MKILFIAAEVAPIIKVGGLSDVVGSLPQALKQLGHDVRIMIPQYGLINSSKYSTSTLFQDRSIKKIVSNERFSLKVIDLDNDTKIYLVDSEKFSSSAVIYGNNELERFLFFCGAAVEALNRMDWQPDVVHCHDWHTALIPRWLKEYTRYGIVFTIHNLAYQGRFDRSFLSRFLTNEDWKSRPEGAPETPLNFMSQGILWSDILTTVSPTYAKEILTLEYGMGLEGLLQYRRNSLSGIVNGLDYDKYNPSTDRYMMANYDSTTLHKRATNKLELQRVTGLEENEKCPIIGMVSRLDEQKGFDIMIDAFDSLLLRTTAQVVILGQGREHYEDMLMEVAKRNSNRVSVLLTFNEAIAQLVYAGCDIFLMPSKFEPCGLGQLLAFRYGAVPVVRHTGGLIDTVQDITSDLREGTGFVFKDYHPAALMAAIERAIKVFELKENWMKLIQRIMALDFSWHSSARKYVAVYRQAIKGKHYAAN